METELVSLLLGECGHQFFLFLLFVGEDHLGIVGHRGHLHAMSFIT